MWVPEGGFWVEMESRTNVKPNTVTIREGVKPGQPTAGSKVTKVTFKDQGVHQIKVADAPRRGIANCIKLTYHSKSSRFGFTGEEFVDIEVLFYNNPACPDPQT